MASSADINAKCHPCLATGLKSEGVVFGQHPCWWAVDPAASGGRATGLQVLNSLTGEKVPFVPREGNRINWYACGPTVYDDSHMGHARSYLTMDIIRRILEDYFSYEVFLQVNVTDIDDKIILRARRNKIVADYIAGATDFAKVKEDVAKAAAAFDAKLRKKLADLEVPKATKREEDERVNELLPQQKFKVDTFAATKVKIDAIIAANQPAHLGELVAAATECLAEVLDAEKGASVTQHEIFEAHARKYEAKFIEDLDSLHIRHPDALTRVTEYVPKIVTFVETIIAKGLAYESNGSVYMDIAKFRATGHAYPKLEPSKGKATEAEMAESEGSHKAEKGEKRNTSDFALWKKSKAGEPSWDSPWGGGRPGWHIECSVMATDLMGDNMDVHAGGVDLKFPHHDNEMCQSEAFHGCAQWVNHFWHFGHLMIKGLKMSKSLKNFITIRQALEAFTARQLRLLFLLQPWYKTIDFSDQTVAEVKTKEATLKNYFDEVKAVLREGWLHRPTTWGVKEKNLHATLMARQATVHTCLCDNFNTPSVMAELLGIASDAFSYMKGNAAPDALLLKKGAMYVTKMLRTFGVIVLDDFGFPIGGTEGGSDAEKALTPMVDALVAFRDEVRAAAKAAKPPPPGLLDVCDKLRDEAMVELGVRIKDGVNGATWNLDDPKALRAEMAEKRTQQLEKDVVKMLNKLSVRQGDLAKAEAAAVPPSALFRQPQYAGKYGAFDEAGKPTADAKGEALSKAASKDVDKALQKHVKAYTAHEEAAGKNPAYIDEIRQDVHAKAAEMRAVLDKGASLLSEELVKKLKLAVEAPAQPIS